MIISRSHAQRHAARARPARRATRLRWAGPSNCAGRGRARDPIQWPHAGDRHRASHRVLPARLSSYADYILRLQDIENPGASRSCCAFRPSHYHSSSPFWRRSTNRRSTPFSSRCSLRFSSRCDLRPSSALFAQPPREINTTAPPQHTPLHTHDTRQAHTSQWTRRGAIIRARRPTPQSTSSPRPTSSEHHPQVCPPPGMRSSFGRPCRCAREAGAHAARGRAMSAPAPARLRRLRARRGAMPLALAIGTCERAASPVLLTACALLPRCRQPQLRAVGLGPPHISHRHTPFTHGAAPSQGARCH